MANEEGKPTQEDTSKPKVRVIAPIEGLRTKPQLAPTKISGVPTRRCAYHPSIPAVYICAQCSRPMCLNCGVPHGYLYLCPQCYQPPQPVQPQPVRKAPQKPSTEFILGLFGSILIIVGFFWPWATSGYISPGNAYYNDAYISGFTITSDYPELLLVITMGILILIVEFMLLLLITSPTMSTRPPIGVRLLPMFLGFIAYVVLAEIVLRAESLITNIQMGWFICVIGANIVMLRGVIEIMKHYKGEGN